MPQTKSAAREVGNRKNNERAIEDLLIEASAPCVEYGVVLTRIDTLKALILKFAQAKELNSFAGQQDALQSYLADDDIVNVAKIIKANPDIFNDRLRLGYINLFKKKLSLLRSDHIDHQTLSSNRTLKLPEYCFVNLESAFDAISQNKGTQETLLYRIGKLNAKPESDLLKLEKRDLQSLKVQLSTLKKLKTTLEANMIAEYSKIFAKVSLQDFQTANMERTFAAIKEKKFPKKAVESKKIQPKFETFSSAIKDIKKLNPVFHTKISAILQHRGLLNKPASGTRQVYYERPDKDTEVIEIEGGLNIKYSAQNAVFTIFTAGPEEKSFKLAALPNGDLKICNPFSDKRPDNEVLASAQSLLDGYFFNRVGNLSDHVSSDQISLLQKSMIETGLLIQDRNGSTMKFLKPESDQGIKFNLSGILFSIQFYKQDSFFKISATHANGSEINYLHLDVPPNGELVICNPKNERDNGTVKAAASALGGLLSQISVVRRGAGPSANSGDHEAEAAGTPLVDDPIATPDVSDSGGGPATVDEAVVSISKHSDFIQDGIYEDIKALLEDEKLVLRQKYIDDRFELSADVNDEGVLIYIFNCAEKSLSIKVFNDNKVRISGSGGDFEALAPGLLAKFANFIKAEKSQDFYATTAFSPPADDVVHEAPQVPQATSKDLTVDGTVVTLTKLDGYISVQFEGSEGYRLKSTEELDSFPPEQFSITDGVFVYSGDAEISPAVPPRRPMVAPRVGGAHVDSSAGVGDHYTPPGALRPPASDEQEKERKDLLSQALNYNQENGEVFDPKSEAFKGIFRLYLLSCTDGIEGEDGFSEARTQREIRAIFSGDLQNDFSLLPSAKTAQLMSSADSLIKEVFGNINHQDGSASFSDAVKKERHRSRNTYILTNAIKALEGADKEAEIVRPATLVVSAFLKANPGSISEDGQVTAYASGQIIAIFQLCGVERDKCAKLFAKCQKEIEVTRVNPNEAAARLAEEQATIADAKDRDLKAQGLAALSDEDRLELLKGVVTASSKADYNPEQDSNFTNYVKALMVNGAEESRDVQKQLTDDLIKLLTAKVVKASVTFSLKTKLEKIIDDKFLAKHKASIADNARDVGGSVGDATTIMRPEIPSLAPPGVAGGGDPEPQVLAAVPVAEPSGFDSRSSSDSDSDESLDVISHPPESVRTPSGGDLGGDGDGRDGPASDEQGAGFASPALSPVRGGDMSRLIESKGVTTSTPRLVKRSRSEPDLPGLTDEYLFDHPIVNWEVAVQEICTTDLVRSLGIATDGGEATPLFKETVGQRDFAQFNLNPSLPVIYSNFLPKEQESNIFAPDTSHFGGEASVLSEVNLEPEIKIDDLFLDDGEKKQLIALQRLNELKIFLSGPQIVDAIMEVPQAKTILNRALGLNFSRDDSALLSLSERRKQSLNDSIASVFSTRKVGGLGPKLTEMISLQSSVYSALIDANLLLEDQNYKEDDGLSLFERGKRIAEMSLVLSQNLSSPEFIDVISRAVDSRKDLEDRAAKVAQLHREAGSIGSADDPTTIPYAIHSVGDDPSLGGGIAGSGRGGSPSESVDEFGFTYADHAAVEKELEEEIELGRVIDSVIPRLSKVLHSNPKRGSSGLLASKGVQKKLELLGIDKQAKTSSVQAYSCVDITGATLQFAGDNLKEFNAALVALDTIANLEYFPGAVPSKDDTYYAAVAGIADTLGVQLKEAGFTQSLPKPDQKEELLRYFKRASEFIRKFIKNEEFDRQISDFSNFKFLNLFSSNPSLAEQGNLNQFKDLRDDYESDDFKSSLLTKSADEEVRELNADFQAKLNAVNDLLRIVATTEAAADGENAVESSVLSEKVSFFKIAFGIEELPQNLGGIVDELKDDLEILKSKVAIVRDPVGESAEGGGLGSVAASIPSDQGVASVVAPITDSGASNVINRTQVAQRSAGSSPQVALKFKVPPPPATSGLIQEINRALSQVDYQVKLSPSFAVEGCFDSRLYLSDEAENKDAIKRYISTVKLYNNIRVITTGIAKPEHVPDHFQVILGTAANLGIPLSVDGVPVMPTVDDFSFDNEEHVKVLKYLSETSVGLIQDAEFRGQQQAFLTAKQKYKKDFVVVMQEKFAGALNLKEKFIIVDSDTWSANNNLLRDLIAMYNDQITIDFLQTDAGADSTGDTKKMIKKKMIKSISSDFDVRCMKYREEGGLEYDKLAQEVQGVTADQVAFVKDKSREYSENRERRVARYIESINKSVKSLGLHINDADHPNNGEVIENLYEFHSGQIKECQAIDISNLSLLQRVGAIQKNIQEYSGDGIVSPEQLLRFYASENVVFSDNETAEEKLATLVYLDCQKFKERVQEQLNGEKNRRANGKDIAKIEDKIASLGLGPIKSISEGYKSALEDSDKAFLNTLSDVSKRLADIAHLDKVQFNTECASMFAGISENQGFVRYVAGSSAVEFSDPDAADRVGFAQLLDAINRGCKAFATRNPLNAINQIDVAVMSLGIGQIMPSQIARQKKSSGLKYLTGDDRVADRGALDIVGVIQEELHKVEDRMLTPQVAVTSGEDSFATIAAGLYDRYEKDLTGYVTKGDDLSAGVESPSVPIDNQAKVAKLVDLIKGVKDKYKDKVSTKLSVPEAEAESKKYTLSTAQIDAELKMNKFYLSEGKGKSECAISKVAEKNRAEVNPTTPYRGIGVKADLVQLGEDGDMDIALKISDIFSDDGDPWRKRFFGIDPKDGKTRKSVDCDELRDKYITHVNIDGKEKSLNDLYKEKGGDIAAVQKAIASALHSNEVVTFVTQKLGDDGRFEEGSIREVKCDNQIAKTAIFAPTKLTKDDKKTNFMALSQMLEKDEYQVHAESILGNAINTMEEEKAKVPSGSPSSSRGATLGAAVNDRPAPQRAGS